ncbi:2-oxoisovalerate dehydrogenase [bacterium]|nr:2-oxoisovalerate dehydrogenase [bacterium]
MPAELIMEVLPEEGGGFNARGVEYAIFTHGRDMAELKANIIEAVSLYFEDLPDPPRSIRLHHLTVSEEVFSW